MTTLCVQAIQTVVWTMSDVQLLFQALFFDSTL